MIHVRYLTFLGVVALATIFFSMFNTPRIRGLRNFGFVATYVGSIAWLVFAPLIAVVTGWCIFGIASGLLYYLYELVSTYRSIEEPKEWPTPMTILHGVGLWPIMLPEAIEYSLTDLGVLGPASISTGVELQPEDETTDK